MKKEVNKKELLKRYAIAAGIGLVVTAGVAIARGLFKAENMQETARILSDALMCGSAILLAYWCFWWAGKTGTFNWLSYSFGALGSWISSLWKKDAPSRIGSESYGDYVERTREERAKKSRTHFLVVGIVLLAASVAAAAAYMNT